MDLTPFAQCNALTRTGAEALDGKRDKELSQYRDPARSLFEKTPITVYFPLTSYDAYNHYSGDD